MITRIEVNGFKSLENFELNLHPGLNVLVGSNGGGKTNVILFFEFLSNLVKTNVSETISRLGGAGAVFRRIGEAEFQSTIQATIYGCQQLEDKKDFCHYKYFFELLFPKKIESVVFDHQLFAMRSTKSFIKAEDNINNIPWDLIIDQTFEKNEPKVKIECKDPKIFRSPFFERHIKKESTIKNRASQIIEKSTSDQNSLFYALGRFFPLIPQVTEDMVSGETYNIVPSRVKVPEDSAKVPGIEKDGSGLAATLYAIKRKKLISRPYGLSYYYYRRPRPIFNKSLSVQDLLKYINLANTSINGIDVVNDPFNYQLKMTLKIVNGDYQAILPLSSMSDGTIKWIALITAVMTTTSMFAIEEPENYLHPLMQSQILNIMRDVLIRRRAYSFSIMTTHSETILNSCNPEELIIVSLSDGMTKAKRCSNAKELKDEIRRTGFKLGYYYLAGAIENE
ncbi:MAG: AAA family ATPase [Nitrospiraceae bacterium]|nr:AAA family ATPase [Nitrospiraceae bacterium]